MKTHCLQRMSRFEMEMIFWICLTQWSPCTDQVLSLLTDCNLIDLLAAQIKFWCLLWKDLSLAADNDWIQTAFFREKTIWFSIVCSWLFTSSDIEELITCLCEVEKRGVCWGLGRSVWPEAGAMQGTTGLGQAGNSGGIPPGQAHSLEEKPDLCLPAIVKEKNSPAL